MKNKELIKRLLGLDPEMTVICDATMGWDDMCWDVVGVSVGISTIMEQTTTDKSFHKGETVIRLHMDYE